MVVVVVVSHWGCRPLFRSTPTTRAGVLMPQPSFTVACGSHLAPAVTTTRHIRPSTPLATQQERQTGGQVSAAPVCNAGWQMMSAGPATDWHVGAAVGVLHAP